VHINIVVMLFFATIAFYKFMWVEFPLGVWKSIPQSILSPSDPTKNESIISSPVNQVSSYESYGFEWHIFFACTSSDDSNETAGWYWYAYFCCHYKKFIAYLCYIFVAVQACLMHIGLQTL